MSTSIMRETALNLHSICNGLKFGRDIDTSVYYDSGDECCLIVGDGSKSYCLVVF